MFKNIYYNQHEHNNVCRYVMIIQVFGRGGNGHDNYKIVNCIAIWNYADNILLVSFLVFDSFVAKSNGCLRYKRNIFIITLEKPRLTFKLNGTHNDITTFIEAGWRLGKLFHHWFRDWLVVLGQTIIRINDGLL